MSRDALPGVIEAARQVLREVAGILERHCGGVIVGGSVPYLLIPQHLEPHEGTVDIDIVLDPNQAGADEVFTLHEILERANFVQDQRRPFRYAKGVEVNGETHQILIELLAGGEPPPSGGRHIATEDVYVSVIPGMEIALALPVEAQLPGEPEQHVKVASLPAFIAMKAAALHRREEPKKAKDAYDIVYCLRNFPGGVDAIAAEFKGALPNPIISSALSLMKEQFASEEAIGPTAYSWDAEDVQDAALKQREAVERVRQLLERIEGL